MNRIGFFRSYLQAEPTFSNYFIFLKWKNFADKTASKQINSDPRSWVSKKYFFSFPKPL